ncbi:hypothetical protein B0H10DRAFT_2088019 [Mycena sp. CBHHK59/15]|nr:hypothetical protein B0H10DRAFT_2088019 [Mycena sp. CBHHK59/15]
MSESTPAQASTNGFGSHMIWSIVSSCLWTLFACIRRFALMSMMAVFQELGILWAMRQWMQCAYKVKRIWGGDGLIMIHGSLLSMVGLVVVDQDGQQLVTPDLLLRPAHRTTCGRESTSNVSPTLTSTISGTAARWLSSRRDSRCPRLGGIGMIHLLVLAWCRPSSLKATRHLAQVHHRRARLPEFPLDSPRLGRRDRTQESAGVLPDLPDADFLYPLDLGARRATKSDALINASTSKPNLPTCT